ncbi:YceD family protein [Phreatobacter sp.]|uniref:YceD family protein n=1 Tax=Phreatobacter sp. TaxID=1966341 RepID=UPI003F714934
MTAPTDGTGRLPSWPVRIGEVSSAGLDVRKAGLPEAALAAFAERIGVDAVTALDLEVVVRPHRGDGLAVVGRVRARVVQTCVVTLEPVDGQIDEEIEATFRPEKSIRPVVVRDAEEKRDVIDAGQDADDPLIGGTVDLAEVAAEFLALGVDPYPRRPDARFEGEGEPERSPFAGLSKRLKDT